MLVEGHEESWSIRQVMQEDRLKIKYDQNQLWTEIKTIHLINIAYMHTLLLVDVSKNGKSGLRVSSMLGCEL